MDALQTDTAPPKNGDSVAAAESMPRFDPIEEASSGQAQGAFMSVLRRHGLFLAGGILALGTVLFLAVYSPDFSRDATATSEAAQSAHFYSSTMRSIACGAQMAS